MKDIPSMFGSMVFNDTVMQEKLPEDVYNALKKTMSQGTHLELDIVKVVANAMKDWAVERGATHYTHWFQPMTGTTAEKHNSFIVPSGDGKVIMEFSGKELVRGESDASSFPSGGLRTTFEARGYTVWDITSYAFIKGNTLYIPTAFCSYSGEALDKKTPLLRSMEAINKQALRVLRLFDNTTVQRVIPMVGSEQEYFLIDKGEYLKRPDLVTTGRTLFGARPPKGSELDDHYFGSLKPRVAAFMKELEEELWQLGVYVKTKHNEVAPSQHELVPIYMFANIAADQNQLIMELMKSVADRHLLACLLHEKPFAGINGSGKHNNWSINTDTGASLFDPGNTPYENAQFLLFLVAVIKAVDDYQDLLRASVASAGNDQRLGAHEAPPSIVSLFLGDELMEILEAIESNSDYKGQENKGQEKQKTEIGVTALPHFLKDATDRNRTSPFAFTGNRFEFRMLGSAFSIAEPIIVLNTAVAEILRQFADRLEKAGDFKSDLASLIKQTFNKHKRIIFDGDNYSDEWVKEAEKRGLSYLKTTVDALPAFISDKSIELFHRQNVFNESELYSRFEIFMESYYKTIHIEALTMMDITKGQIIPASINYQCDLSRLLQQKKECGDFDVTLEDYILGRVSGLSACLLEKLTALESALSESTVNQECHARTALYQNSVLIAMNELRIVVDELETLVAKKYWPLPSYAELLYSVV